MSGLKQFLKANKKVKENIKVQATKSLCDEDGEPLFWEIKALTTAEDDEIRESCTTEVQVTGKPGLFRQKTDATLYIAKMVAASIVYPDLEDAELQDSYGVKTPWELLKEMVDNPAEYNALVEVVTKNSGIVETMSDKVNEAKN